MLKKLLFLLILAGIGFGIYTGINKIVQIVNTPDEQVTVTTTEKTVDIPESSDIIDIEDNTPGFFTRTWTTITSWFSSDDVEIIETSESEEVLSGEVFSGEVLSGDTIVLSGDVFDWESTSTGETENEEISKDTSNESTEKSKISSGVTTTVTTVTTVQKPATTSKKTATTKTTVTTNTTTKDPLLDSLFK